MKIALCSDIHANLPAFEAFLDGITRTKPDAIYCLGDLIGYNVWPNEIIDEIRKRGIATIAGNHDLKVKHLVTTANQLTQPDKDYAYHLVSPEGRQYLSTLPAHIRLEFQLNQQPLNIVLAHGSTRSIDEYILEDLDAGYVLAMMEEAHADILCIGHSHKPYHRTLQAANGGIKHVINVGSVGKPKDGNPQGCYVIITVGDRETSTIGVEFIRFSYDVEKAATAVIQSPLPNELADRLRLAY